LIVSVVIPTYNRSLLLAEAIKSVIDQTYRPIECIVVDDGSIDNSHEVVSKIKITDISSFTIKYIFQQNAGSQAARNTGTAAAAGEFIQYLDSDDLLYPDKIKSQVIYFNQHPDCDAVFGDWEVGTKEKKEKIVAYKKDNLVEQFLTERCIHTLSFLMRSSLIKKIGLWDEEIKRNQEIDFHLRAVLAGGNFAYLPGVCGLWRVHDGERIVSATGMNHIMQFYKKWEIRLKQENMFTKQLSLSISNLYMWLISQNKKNDNNELIPMLKETIRLNPEIPFYKSKKLKFVMKLVGKNTALKIWLVRFRQSTR
jgi:glycosyltransferase involved in cell wall biosynthesis